MIQLSDDATVGAMRVGQQQHSPLADEVTTDRLTLRASALQRGDSALLCFEQALASRDQVMALDGVAAL